MQQLPDLGRLALSATVPTGMLQGGGGGGSGGGNDDGFRKKSKKTSEAEFEAEKKRLAREGDDTFKALLRQVDARLREVPNIGNDKAREKRIKELLEEMLTWLLARGPPGQPRFHYLTSRLVHMPDGVRELYLRLFRRLQRACQKENYKAGEQILAISVTKRIFVAPSGRSASMDHTDVVRDALREVQAFLATLRAELGIEGDDGPEPPAPSVNNALAVVELDTDDEAAPAPAAPIVAVAPAPVSAAE